MRNRAEPTGTVGRPDGRDKDATAGQLLRDGERARLRSEDERLDRAAGKGDEPRPAGRAERGEPRRQPPAACAQERPSLVTRDPIDEVE